MQRCWKGVDGLEAATDPNSSAFVQALQHPRGPLDFVLRPPQTLFENGAGEVASPVRICGNCGLSIDEAHLA